MENSLDLLLKYPRIIMSVTTDSDTIAIHGDILVNNTSISVSLHQITHIDGTQKYHLKQLSHIPKTTFDSLQDNLPKCNFGTVTDVLDHISRVILQESCCQPPVNHSEIYTRVLHEYSEFLKFFLNLNSCKLKEDFSEIIVSASDSNSRLHSVTIKVNFSNDSEEGLFHLAKYDLPQKENDSFKSNDNLTMLFNQFLAEIEFLQPYFDFMEALDQNATILDPEVPQKRDVYRRIWLGENISTIIKVDPFNIYERPEIKFLGSEQATAQYSAHLNDNLANWQSQENTFQALLELLGIPKFPIKEIVKQSSNAVFEDGECCICFSLRREDKLPEVVCSNRSCSLVYHNKCLYQWFITLNARRVFNTISGNCYNCGQTISCSILD